MSSNAEVNDFLAYIGSERGLATNTKLAYERDLEQFELFCRRKNINILSMTLRNLRDFLASLRKQGVSARSLARKLSAVKQFYKFLLREGKIDSDPSELISITVKSKTLPKHLSVEEMFALIDAARGENETEIRDRALLEMWYATGARVSEMAQLRIDGIDWEEKVVKLIGKGSRERLVPISHSAVEWGRKFQAIRHRWLAQRKIGASDLFFISRSGKGFTRQGVWKIVKKYAQSAGLGRNVWPHMIRHSFATHVLQGGADLRAVQELLGHRSISTTEVYTHLDIENLKLMQLKYHPRG